MAITIYACGKIDRIEDVPRLVDELKVIAGASNRTYQIIGGDDTAKPVTGLTRYNGVDPASAFEGSAGLKGIRITLDPDAEPVSILFDQSGVLTDMVRHASWIRSNGQSERYTAFKTQFANIDPRLRINELFAGLKKKYITDLTVTDEDAFWKTRDRRRMRDERIILGHCLRYAELVIGGVEISDDAVRNADAIATRLEEAILKAKNPLAGSELAGNRDRLAGQQEPERAEQSERPESPWQQDR